MTKAKPQTLGKERWKLRLYVAGQTPKSITALTNLKNLCEGHLASRYRTARLGRPRRAPKGRSLSGE
jgi:hypothetical protein